MAGIASPIHRLGEVIIQGDYQNTIAQSNHNTGLNSGSRCCPLWLLIDAWLDQRAALLRDKTAGLCIGNLRQFPLIVSGSWMDTS